MGSFSYAILVAFISVCVYVSTTNAGLSKDLPSPPANVRNVPKGSLIMPMDNKQLISNNFNIKTYGLAVHLLYSEVPLYWAIKAGKAKDGQDFAATATQVYPSVGSIANYQYYSGPFIILKAYQQQAMNAIGSFQGGNHGVVIHRLEADVLVDIRHEIFIKPKILISNLSQYSPTQTNILNAAGLVKDKHYIITDTGGAISALDAKSCYTFFSEPHYLYDADAPGYYSAVRAFVNSGGNFLAECAGAFSYENYNPGGTRGGFQSLAGLYTYGTDNTDLDYPNPDTPYNQFYGSLDGVNSGHTPDYCWKPPTNIGSTQVTQDTENSWITNNGYYVVVNKKTAAICTNGQTRIIASVSKPGQGNGLGGLVFYLGAHDWSGASTNGNRDAGKRLYLNAMITPSTRDLSCGFNFCPPGQECPHDECHTCVCDDGGSPITTKIAGCCLSTADCPACTNCNNKQCDAAPCGGACATCNTGTGQCQPVACPCTKDSDCQPCYGCDPDPNQGGALACLPLSDNCCDEDADCGLCGYCDTAHPITPSRSTKPFFICQPKPQCCESVTDCGPCTSCTSNKCVPNCNPCQTCDSGTCNDVAGCCNDDTECGSCKVCDGSTSTCVDCPACTTCSGGTTCDPVADCCTLDDQCAHCESCQDNACKSTITGELGSCCSSPDDCTADGSTCASFGTCEVACTKDSQCSDCQACVDGVCQDSSCGDGDGDSAKGDGDSAPRMESILF